MAKRLFLLCILLPAALFLPVTSFAGRLTIGDERVVVRFDDHLQNAAREIMSLYPSVRAELKKDLGWETNFRPEVVLIRDNDTFRKISGSDLITALAVPKEDLIVIDYAKMGAHPFTTGVTLKHELCHLELHRHITEAEIPRWLDEGICQWVTGGFGELINDGGRSVLDNAVVSKRLLSIERLAEGFPTDGRDLILAYEESKSIIEYIKQKYGVSGVRGILEQMGRGDDLETAVRKSLSISLDELEKQWRLSLSRKSPWPSYIRDYLYEILFSTAALITVCGFFRMLRKRRQYKDEEEDEESGDEGDT